MKPRGANSTVSTLWNSTPPPYPRVVAGVSSTDKITGLDNSTSGKTLQFEVSGTIPGATVTIYADGTAIGSGTAGGTTTTVTTDGTHDLVAMLAAASPSYVIGPTDPPDRALLHAGAGVVRELIRRD